MTPSFSSVPPALFGLQISASSNRVAGGNARPSLCGTRPVALHTAVISMPDLVPSTNELNIFGLIELRSVILQILVEDVPHVVGIGLVVVRLVARALAGRDHLEAAGARPVDMLADQRRLIAPGEAVDDARLLCLARKQRTGERVGLDIDHHDVLAVRDRIHRMRDAGLRHAGRLDDHFDAGTSDQRLGIVGDERARRA